MSTGVRAIDAAAPLVSSGHFLHVLAARWPGRESGAGSLFLLWTASLSALGYEHGPAEPVIRIWNDTRHVDT